MPWEIDEETVRSLIQSHALEPWAKAWTTALAARGGVGMGDRAEGVLHSALHADWTPRLRHIDEVRRRIDAMAHLARAAEVLDTGDADAFGAAWDRFEQADIPAEDLEHLELGLVATLLDSKMPAEGVRSQLRERAHAAVALTWALHGVDDLDAAHADPTQLSARLADLELDEARPVEGIREALTRTATALAETDFADPKHAVLVEHIKALMWMTEPWWPGLALTPWRLPVMVVEKGDAPEAADSDRPVPDEPVVAIEPADPSMRVPSDVLEMGLSLLLQGSYLADAVRKGPILVGPMKRLAEQTGITPQTADIARLATWVQDEKGTEPTDAELTRLVWLSACADALFWAVGTLDSLPDGDPDEEPYTDLIPVIRAGGIPARLKKATLRPRPEIEAEHVRWRSVVEAASPGSLEESFGIQRSRGLRWILDPRWDDPTVTPWDDSETAKPFTPASLSPPGPSMWRVAGAIVLGLVALSALAAWALGAI